MLQQVRYALRSIAKRPSYAIVTVLVLSIAIGANTTVFSVLNAFLIRPLPYPESERLVLVFSAYTKIGLANAGTAIPDYLERRAQAQSLEDLAIVTTNPRTLGGEAEPERVLVSRASASLFDVLRVAPALGRSFTEAEATLGNDRVAVLSDELWRTRFGARADIVGSTVRLDGEAFSVIGVMPRDFGFPNRDIGAWVPFAFTPEQASDAARGMEFSMSIGRLRPGATVAALDAELDAIVHRNVGEGRLARDVMDVAGFTGRAEPLRESRVRGLEPMLATLQLTVLAVLLIACANVANLQLARTAARRRELAVRAALGAGGTRLIGLVLIESLLLASIGACVGIALAVGGLELVRGLGLDWTSDGFDFTLDRSVLAFTLATTVLAALLSSVPPVIAVLRDDVANAVREGSRQTASGRGSQILRNALVVTQIGVSLALLVGAGLLGKSFNKLASEGPGFDTANVWTAAFALPRQRYDTPEARARFQGLAIERLHALPGVTAAGFTSALPFSGTTNQGSLAIDGYELPPGGAPPHANVRAIDEGFLPSLGIAVLRGRNFAASEPEPVVIVDANLADKYWPGGRALGQRVRFEIDAPERWYTIVGVVPAIKDSTLAEKPTKETVYWHYTQRPSSVGAFTLRTTLPIEQTTRAARAAVASLDPELALFGTQSMEDRVLRSLGPQRAPMVLSILFAAAAVLLATIGVYGVLTWAVAQRVGEIGVRVALGARAADVLAMILKQGGRLTAIGLVLGAAGAAALGRALASQIRNVSSLDPAVFAAAIVGIVAAAIIGSWLPARRAARIDPMRALREE